MSRLVTEGALDIVEVHEVEHTHYPFGTNFTVDMTSGRLRLILEVDGACYAARDMARMGEMMRRALSVAADVPDTPYGDQLLVDAAEAAWIAEVSTGRVVTTSEPTAAFEAFLDLARLNPDAPAIGFDGDVLSYAELQARAFGLAAHLKGLGLQRGDAVAV